jgi:hypothetical protein
MSNPRPELSSRRRFLLARKGQTLYQKSCGTRGRGLCVESFAYHQLRQGHMAVVHDLLEFLDNQIEALRAYDPDARLVVTEELASRIRQALAEVIRASSTGQTRRETTT